MTTLPNSFTSKVRASTCHVWVGSTNDKGYGVAVVKGQKFLAHRLAYEAEFGPIPDGMVIDHVCRVRNCVNPQHLEAVTQAENVRRGRSAAGLAVGDECINGHVIRDEVDLYRRPSGAVECRPCRRIGAKRGPDGSQTRPTRQRRAPAVRAATDAVDAALLPTRITAA